MKQVANILFYLEADLDAAALNRVAEVAKASGARLTLASVVEPAGSYSPLVKRDHNLNRLEQLYIDERRNWLEEAATIISDQQVEITIRVFVGDPIETVLQAVRDGGFDLLVKTPSPTEGLRQRLFGSIDINLMRSCPCPVLIAHPKTKGYSGRAVAAVSFDAGDEAHARLNHEILNSAAFVLKTQFAAVNEIHVVHAWKMYGESMLADGLAKVPKDEFQALLKEEEEQSRKWLDELIDDCRNRMDNELASFFEPRVSLLHGDPKVVVPDFVKKLDADILAMGTVSRKGLAGHIIGNTAEEILTRIDCSLVTHNLVTN